MADAFRNDELPRKASKQMLIRSHNDTCLVAMNNGLTLELTYNEGSTYGVWLLGERFLWWVVAGAA
jgi:hypothetical protein